MKDKLVYRSLNFLEQYVLEIFDPTGILVPAERKQFYEKIGSSKFNGGPAIVIIVLQKVA